MSRYTKSWILPFYRTRVAVLDAPFGLVTRIEWEPGVTTSFGLRLPGVLRAFLGTTSWSASRVRENVWAPSTVKVAPTATFAFVPSNLIDFPLYARFFIIGPFVVSFEA